MNEMEIWADVYASRQSSAVRGGRRMLTRAEIKQDLKAAFPLASWWAIFQMVWWIWSEIRSRAQTR